MKIALCLYGLTGSSTNKWGLGTPLDPSIAYKYYVKNLIKANPNDNVDIFIHSQSKNFKKKLENIYQPKMSIIEKQKDFTYAVKKHPSIKYSLSLITFFLDLFKFFYTFKSPFAQKKIRILKLTNCYSRWYSTKILIDLKKKYEKKKNFKYDMVFVSRLDMALLKPFRIRTFSKSKLTISHSNYFYRDIKDQSYKASKKIIDNVGAYDFWFIGPSNIIDKFGVIFNRIEKYNINPHFAVLQHCEHMGIKIAKKMYRFIDYELLRIKLFNSKIF